MFHSPLFSRKVKMGILYPAHAHATLAGKPHIEEPSLTTWQATVPVGLGIKTALDTESTTMDRPNAGAAAVQPAAWDRSHKLFGGKTVHTSRLR